MELPTILYILLPLLICSGVTIALVVIFRTELHRCLRSLFYTLVMYACICFEVVKDIRTRKQNVMEPASPPGNVAVVTGARGIGFEVIKKLLERNFHVIIGCRDLTTGQRAEALIRASGVMSGTTSIYKLDLASFASIRAFAEQVLQNHPELHILVNNAGLTLTKRALTEEGNEMTFAVNYLGTCFLTHLLLSRLAESARNRGINARIVNNASAAHLFPFLGAIRFEDLTLRDNYNKYVAYAQSKLAMVMFTITLAAKLRASHVPVVVTSLHPGIVDTAMVSSTSLLCMCRCFLPLTLRSPEQGARTVYYACASPDLENKGGAYIYSNVVTPPGKAARSEEDRAKLWSIMLDKLDLKSFGNLE